MKLLRGIWESLELDEGYMNNALDLDACFQVCVANLYPPCPQPELAMGLPPHSDHGLLTLLHQNGVDGLQVKHGSKWVHVKPPPNSFLVNTGDHMEIVTNGRHKSVLHRAVINGRSTRMSIATVVAPSPDTVVEPVAQLVSSERPAMYRGVRYREYLEHQQGNKLRENQSISTFSYVGSIMEQSSKSFTIPRCIPFLSRSHNSSIYFITTFATLVVLVLLQIEVLTSSVSTCSLSWPFFDQALHRDESSIHTELGRARSMLRDSVTFLPLKDLRFAKEPMSGHTWFMSSMNDTFEGDETQHLYFPSEASKGRLLCLSARDTSDGTKNSYALAWPEALPHDATLFPGLTFVSDTYYDHGNLWHGTSAILPFVSWHQRKECAVPDRWVLFHWGELRTSMGAWVHNLTNAAIGEVRIEDLRGHGGAGPACFEKAVVYRHNEGAMKKQRRRAVYDMMRCKARAYCGVTRATMDPKAIRMTLLLRLGSRSFKNESTVIRIFEKECAKVGGCVVKVAWGNNMTFCDQVRLNRSPPSPSSHHLRLRHPSSMQVKLMSETDILVSPHGCQLTNLFLLDKNSSIMEFYPKGWQELAGVGQYIYGWMANWAGMQHKGSWRDPHGEECPHADKLACFLFYKDAQIGHDEAHFAGWAAKVLGEVKETKSSEASSGSRHTDLAGSSIPCPCDM
ncbi:hypothetical protein BHE74_00052466 [Ensete ventricosum]|nr:hypothetical protein BHE74_00052466 [Ensete ventricosum]